MKTKKLKKLLNSKLADWQNDCPVWFYNPNERKGSPYYEIEFIEFSINDSEVQGLVLSGEKVIR